MTRACILGDTVLVDYATCWVKVHIMQDTSGISTLKVKEYFEHDCMTQNVLPKHYDADNGRFAEILSIKIVKAKCNILISVALMLIKKMVFLNGLLRT